MGPCLPFSVCETNPLEFHSKILRCDYILSSISQGKRPHQQTKQATPQAQVVLPVISAVINAGVTGPLLKSVQLACIKYHMVLNEC